jgi:FKBP-type peptidyl-prolyl cis-trans isomerase
MIHMNKFFGKSLFVLLFMVTNFVAFAQADSQRANPPQLMRTSSDSLYYAAGLYIASWIKDNGMKQMFNKPMFQKGLMDKLNGATMKMGDSLAFDKVSIHVQKHAAETAKKKEQAFLKKLSTTTGVGKLPNGVYFQEHVKGTGTAPVITDSVMVHLRGETIEHVRIADTYQSNQASTLALSRLVPGLAEAITYMRAGAKWTVYVPSILAYGSVGLTDVIPPNSLLVFEVELLAIKSVDAN